MNSSFRKAQYKVLCKYNYHGNVIYNGLVQSAVKIYQRDFFKLAVLKCFTKGAMLSSFPKVPRTKPSTRKKIKEMQSLIELPKVTALKHFRKKAMTRSFPGASSTKASTSKLLRK